MAKLHDDWKVLPHGALNEVAPRILTVVGQVPMPLGNFPRRMTILGMDRNRTAIFSPIPLGEREMKGIEALGAPAYLIVPNGSHRLDLRPFHVRYPKAKIVSAPGAKSRVEEAAGPVQTRANIGSGVELTTLAGSGDAELAMIVRHGSELTLVTNDIIGNVAHPNGIGARIMSRLMGFGPRPRITRPARWFFIKDKAALALQLREWSQLPGLRRLIPSHGDIVDRPATLLARLADELAG